VATREKKEGQLSERQYAKEERGKAHSKRGKTRGKKGNKGGETEAAIPTAGQEEDISGIGEKETQEVATQRNRGRRRGG